MIHVVDGNAQERAKYAEIWSIDEYRDADSPGLINVDRFMATIAPEPHATLIDIGCGSGKAELALEKKGLRAHWLDITAAGLDPQIDRARFIEAPLWSSVWSRARPLGWDYGFCCDVLEHIPTEYTMLVLDRIIRSCRTTWLQIAMRPDEYGRLVGEPLHLTVRPYAWWLVRLATLGKVIDARDLCGDGLFVVERA